VRILRGIGAATIGLCASLLVLALSVQPYRANILKKRVERQLEALEVATGGRAPSFEALRIARENVSEIRSAMRYMPTDADLHFELAAHYGILGQLDGQIATYDRLLKFHRRPEIFHNLATAEFEARQYRRSVESFSYAVAFDYLYIHSVPEALKNEVTRRAEQISVDLAAKLMPQ
jgi:tetratricopeptide (TPR) repeat protein